MKYLVPIKIGIICGLAFTALVCASLLMVLSPIHILGTIPTAGAVIIGLGLKRALQKKG